MNPSDAFVEAYAAAAARASVFELKCRMLADKTEGLEKAAHGGFADLVDALVTEFASNIATHDEMVLRTARRLRNKIVHSDFHDAREVLAELTSVGPGGVQHIDLSSGDVRAVADTSSTKDGRVLGWLLELGSAGAFLASQRVFNRAIEIVEQLAWVEVERARKRGE